ncbi:MAG: DNA repair protein RecN [Solirubrobacterales bacterium]|nr:DNA repair protein RecN [Solirubrobacterales bacterium]MBV9713763.1 DNA repair protein RecN [Solirubrobacterales bacterium]
MLHELRIENLLLLDRAELRLGPGLNVLTGETGAGKTLLAHALDLLLGGRARAGLVRAGAAEAYVEGVFSRPPRASVHELIPDGADEIVLARRLWPDGRTRAYLCGRSATVADLRELGSQVLSFYGQHEHRKLMLATAQLEILDAHCGARQLQLRSELRAAYDRVRELAARVAELAEMAAGRERELDLLEFELDEIEAVGPRQDEADALGQERERLRHVEGLRAAAALGAEMIAPEAGGGVGDLLAHAARQMESAAAIDPELRALFDRLQALLYEARDLGGELRSYVLGIEGSPERLEQVEDRLAAFARLERKHGGTIADVVRHAEECRRRREQLEHADLALGAAEADLAAARAELDRLAGELSAARHAAAPRLAAAVRERLAELAMPDARFEVDVRPRADGCGPRGADGVELLIAPNAGLPAGPLREIASGGELSRVMLALLSVAHGDGAEGASAAMLVFDEVDAGIGGHTARAVGEQLRQLARGRQVLCITHLPQVAALAERHFTIAKDASTVPATTTVTELNGDSVVGELVRMLGAGEGDRAASRHARQLLKAA